MKSTKELLVFLFCPFKYLGTIFFTLLLFYDISFAMSEYEKVKVIFEEFAICAHRTMSKEQSQASWLTMPNYNYYPSSNESFISSRVEDVKTKEDLIEVIGYYYTQKQGDSEKKFKVSITLKNILGSYVIRASSIYYWAWGCFIDCEKEKKRVGADLPPRWELIRTSHESCYK